MSINIDQMLADWPLINQLFTPTLKLFPESSAFDKNLAETSLVAAREEFWQVYICLMGFCQERNRDPNEILRQIPFDSYLKERKIESGFEQEGSFLRYCTSFKTVSRESLFSAAYVLRLTIAESSIKNTTPDIECIRSCLDRYKENHSFDFYKCVREEQCEHVEN